MHRPRLIVLKFGGSVLARESDLSRVVHEIYRWRRAGWQVLAVVSALADRTDALLGCCGAFCDDASPHAVAARIALGEFECATQLGLHLDRAGVPAFVLSPGRARLRAVGPALDAQLDSVNARLLRRGLIDAGVVVLPGFVAADDTGRTVVLGRGGSDLTALFLAHRLRAERCRLIKDVCGLYESDPHAEGARPRRFSEATCADALETDGSIIQSKAVRFAARQRSHFELGTFNSDHPTVIGTQLSHFAMQPMLRRPLRVALLGVGTVGSGVYALLSQSPDRFHITQVVARDWNKQRSIDVDRSLRTTNLDEAAASGADVVIELIGGVDEALAAHRTALANGSHVVTANKALIAGHGHELRLLAAKHDVQLRCSAAVAGSVPLLERLACCADRLVRVRAVLNGTSNYVLQRLAAGDSTAQAVRAAIARGYAESDPSRDLNGRDAMDKLEVIAQTTGLPAAVDGTEPITASTASRAVAAVRRKRRLRQVAELARRGNRVRLRVALRECGVDDVLFDVPDAHNAAELHWRDGRTDVLRGRGAGRWPTAESVMADVLDIVRDCMDDAQRSWAPQSVGAARRRLPTCT